MKPTKPLIRLKSKALELFYKGQLPSALVKAIYDLTIDDDIKYVEFLKDLSIEYMRIQGYYKNDIKSNLANNMVRDIILNYKKKGELNNG